MQEGGGKNRQMLEGKLKIHYSSMFKTKKKLRNTTQYESKVAFKE